MDPTPMVHVFTSGNSGLLGFSLQKSGDDLPPIASHLGIWSRAYEIPMSDTALDAFRVDTLAVLTDLGSCGYHVARPAQAFLDLPKHHRGSS